MEFVDLTVESKAGRNQDSFVAAQPGSFALAAEGLVSVSGGLSFINIIGMEILPLYNLQSVEDTITFSNVTFAEGASDIGSQQFPRLSTLGSLYIAGTGATNISFANNLEPISRPLETKTWVSIVATNNQALAGIEIHGYEAAKLNVDIAGNDPLLSVSLPDISQASLVLRGLSHFDAENLTILSRGDTPETARGLFISDSTFGTLNLPSLARIEDTTLTIDNNTNLSSLRLQSLVDAFSLKIISNPKLKNVELGSLGTIGTLEISGGPLNK